MAMNHILIIEDSITTAEYIRDLLEQEKYLTTIASNGNEAFKAMNFAVFNLVILDLHLPDEHGIEILKKIRRKKHVSELPVIVLTASKDKDAIIKTLNQGANDFISKPFEELTFLIKIKNLVQLQNANQALIFRNDEIQELARDLKESRERYKLLSNSTFEGIVIHDNGIARDMNESLPKMFGYKKKELINKNIIPLLVHPDDIKVIHENVKRNYAKPYEVRGIRKDGIMRRMEIEAKNVQYNGKEIRIAAVRDITWRKETEQLIKEERNLLETIINNIPDIIAIQEPDHTIVSYNSQGYKALGMSPGEVNGKKCYELLGRKISCHECATNRALKSKKTEWVEKYVPEMGIWVHAMSIPILDESNRVKLIIEKIQDISERKKAEREIESQNKELKEINYTKDKLFSIIGHDLKNPLNNIILFSELLGKKLENAPKEKIRMYQESIHQSAFSILNLLNNLLDWSRLQGGDLICKYTALDLNSLVEEIIELLNHSAMNKKIELKNHVPKHLTAYADQAMISTVLRNLISNALKFTENGGTVEITGTCKNGRAHLSVKDNGVGIHPERIRKIFNPSEHKSQPGTAGEKGTGLGLLICKEFIEKNNAKINVESELGKGTTFYIELPMVAEN